VWFVDVPTEHEVYKKKTERSRRVDIWVPAIADLERQVSVWYWIAAGSIIFFCIALGYAVQVYQWERERHVGIHSAWWRGM
jgi:hypothetical protein